MVGAESFSILVNHRYFQEPGFFSRVSGGFLGRRIPAKNGEGTPRMVSPLRQKGYAHDFPAYLSKKSEVGGEGPRKSCVTLSIARQCEQIQDLQVRLVCTPRSPAALTQDCLATTP